MNPQTDTALDKFNLDEEAKLLPSMVGRYHEEVFDTTEELNEVAFELEKAEAVARKKIRERYTALNVKFTIDSVNDELALDKTVCDLRKEVAKLKNRINYYKGILAALEVKKSSINNLVTLYTRDYYLSYENGNGKEAEADHKHRFSGEFGDLADKNRKSLADAMKNKTANANKGEEV